MPGFIEPCQPEIGGVPEKKDEELWAPEVKLDGYRVQAHVSGRKAILYTRRGYDWTSRFAPIADELATLAVRTAILDGEVVVPDESGVPDFHALHADLAKGRTDRLMYYLFDLLYLDGFDLRDASLRDRRAALRLVLQKEGKLIHMSETFHTTSAALFEFACRMQLEGIVIKRWDAPYRSGKQDAWRKIKCKNSDTFPIVAFVEKLQARPRRIASLYLGRYEDGKLPVAARVSWADVEAGIRPDAFTMDSI